MNNWFEEWENGCLEYASDYLEKIEESDETERCNSNRKKSREVARVRNLRFKSNQVKRFYASVWRPNSSGAEEEVKDLIQISHTLTNYYVDTPDKPSHIKRIEGEHNYYTWAGPKWNKSREGIQTVISAELKPTSLSLKAKRFSRKTDPAVLIKKGSVNNEKHKQAFT